MEPTEFALKILIIAIVGYFTYATEDLDCVKNAFFYRVAYALMCTRGAFFLAELIGIL